MQKGYDINHLFLEAESRWLKPVEVLYILKNFKEDQLTHQIPQKPHGGSVYLVDKRVLKYFRKDGHSWRRRKNHRTIAEGHERLKVDNVEALNCYYAHGEENRNFQRRSYWMLQKENEHVVLVHYRDTGAVSVPHWPHLSSIIGDSHELIPIQSGASSVDISSSDVIRNRRMNLDIKECNYEVNGLSVPESSKASRMIELQLNDDRACKFATCIDNDYPSTLEHVRHNCDVSCLMPSYSDNLPWDQFSDDSTLQQHRCCVSEVDIWNGIIDSSKTIPDVELLELGGLDSQNLFILDDLGISHEDNMSLTVTHRQKFTIQEISPDWCYASGGAKIIIIGSFLCDPSEYSWACMFGDIEVPVQIIREGVIRCHAPPHLEGKVTLCITSGNRESCSEVRDFVYCAEPIVCNHGNPRDIEGTKSSEELSLLVRFVQIILSDEIPDGDASKSGRDLFSKSPMPDEKWGRVIDSLSIGTLTTANALDCLMQELLKDKLGLWLSSRSQKSAQNLHSLSKKERGIIHVAAGLGYDWALRPILNVGVNVNFRDSNGWAALHWAAKFGREKMAAALVASGASAGAITDPTSLDHVGKTPASIATICGHMGLAGYLSEVALTSHLSSLTLQESELSKGSAALEAEQAVNSLSNACSYANEDQSDLKDTLAAVRHATLAASRIQSAFHVHSFRKRRLKEAAAAIFSASEDDYHILESDIQGLSAASKLTFRHPRDHESAVLSIQKKYRGWKSKKDYLSLRQKVIKIQAHVRGYQARKKFNVSWAVSILEKVILRWRRRGVGLRGFHLDSEIIDVCDEEDILRVFRQQKVEAAINEAVSRVLSMVESPTACQQYGRILEKYRQAWAELQSGRDSDMAFF